MRGALRTAFFWAAGPVTRMLVTPCQALNQLPGQWRVPILLYHQVAGSGSPNGYPWRVTPAMFETHMRWLADGGYHVVSLAEFMRARQDGQVVPRSVVLTFDDGFRGMFLHAYPVLKRYGFPATLFLATGSIGMAEFPWIRQWLGGHEDPDEYRPLGWDEVRSMDAGLITLGSHTVTHPHLGRLSRRDMEWEVVESRRQIEEGAGQPPSFFSYPGGIAHYGDHSMETRQAVTAAGYECALVSEIGRNGRRADLFSLKRLGLGAEDTLALFRAKVLGAYTWSRAMQWAAHRAFTDPAQY